MAELNCVDMSRWGGPLTQEEALCLIGRGVTHCIVGVGNPHGAGLWARKQAEMWGSQGGENLGAYVYLRFCGDAEGQLAQAFSVLSGISVDYWSIDAEDVSSDIVGMRQDEVRAYLWKCIRAVESRGYDPIIYTGQWWWRPKVGPSKEFGGYRLWDSNYPDAASVDSPVVMPWVGREYGGFGEPVIYQYKGTTDFCGQSVDLNWARDVGGNGVDKDLRNLVVGNGLDCTPWEDIPGEETVLDLFPAGTVPMSRSNPNPSTVRLTGDAAFEYAKRRGFSFGLGLADVSRLVQGLLTDNAAPAGMVNAGQLADELEKLARRLRGG